MLNLQQGPPKGTTTSSRGRGRPKKTEEKPELTGEDEDEQEEEEEEEENWSIRDAIGEDETNTADLSFEDL